MPKKDSSKVQNPQTSSSHERIVENWLKIIEIIEDELRPETFDRWFSDVDCADISEEELVLVCPSPRHEFWIRTNYNSLITAATTLATGKELAVRFIQEETLADGPSRDFKAKTGQPSLSGIDGRSGCPLLNKRNTFDSFVVGLNNEIAHAACVGVSNSPGGLYNPLFIYGGVGLGKTHLLHAIGHRALTQRPEKRVIYVTSETFANEFVSAIQTNRILAFRKRYREADLLLIDDIQFLAEKGRTQEEFFHMFNSLFDGHKQIVLSSDRPASEVHKLESRLVSRFEWGLTAELEAPDVETRLAILQKKAQQAELAVNDELFAYLAKRIRTNVRRLEGALARIASYVSLNNGLFPSMEIVEHLLKDILTEETRQSITIEEIQRKIAEHFDIRLADMASKRRSLNIALPRQVAMYFSREFTRASLSEIGEAFGGKGASSILHACKLVKARMQTDESLRQTLSFLEMKLQRS